MSLEIVIFDYIATVLLWFLMLKFLSGFASSIKKKSEDRILQYSLMDFLGGTKGVGYLGAFGIVAVLFGIRLFSMSVDDPILRLLDLFRIFGIAVLFQTPIALFIIGYLIRKAMKQERDSAE